MHKILLIILLSITLFFPQSEVLAVSCSAAGANVYTTDSTGKAAGPIIGKPFNIEAISPKIKTGSAYKFTLNQGALPLETYNIQAVEDGKISSPGWQVSTDRTPGNYSLTLYDTGGKEICTTQGFQVFNPAQAAAIAAGGGGGGAPTGIDCSKPANTDKCTGGKGMACNLSDGSPISDPTAKRDPATTGIYTAIGCVPTEPKTLIESVLKYGTLAAGGIAFLVMILAALQMITAEGNPETLKNARDKFYSAIIGLLLIIFSVLLMQVIGVDILGLPGFGRLQP